MVREDAGGTCHEASHHRLQRRSGRRCTEPRPRSQRRGQGAGGGQEGRRRGSRRRLQGSTGGTQSSCISGGLRGVLQLRHEDPRRRQRHGQGRRCQQQDEGDDLHADGRDPGRSRIRSEEVSARVGLREGGFPRQVRQRRLGDRRAGHGVRAGQGQRRRVWRAVSVSPGVWLYQVAGDSLALELTAKGTKYYKDSDLN